MRTSPRCLRRLLQSRSRRPLSGGHTRIYNAFLAARNVFEDGARSGVRCSQPDPNGLNYSEFSFDSEQDCTAALAEVVKAGYDGPDVTCTNRDEQIRYSRDVVLDQSNTFNAELLHTDDLNVLNGGGFKVRIETTNDGVNRVLPSTSCVASSQYAGPGGGYGCEKAFDDVTDSSWATWNEGVGSWIRSDFGATYTISRFEYRHRSTPIEYNRGITLSFSDGTSQTFTLENREDIQSFAIVPVQSSFVNLTVVSVYGTINNGARQIRFYGYGLSTCGSAIPLTPESASSPDGLVPDHGNSEALLMDGDLGTYWDQTDGAGPHILQLNGPYTLGGYSFVAYEPNFFAPKTWTLTCDGNTIDIQSDYNYLVPRSSTTFATCFGVTHICSTVQLIISAWYDGSPAIREFSLLSSTDTTGSELLNPSEAARSYSTTYGGDMPGTGHARSMLDSAQAWTAATAAAGQWMQIDLGTFRQVVGVAIQGRGDYPDQYVTSFEVQCSMDGVHFTTAGAGWPQNTIFSFDVHDSTDDSEDTNGMGDGMGGGESNAIGQARKYQFFSGDATDRKSVV